MPNDFDTDMQTISNYVVAVMEAKTKIITSFLSAIDNFQVTVQAASPLETSPDILSAILKTGLKAAEKSAVNSIKSSTGADLGPLVDLIHNISDEIDKAAKASQNLAVAEWIGEIRTTVTNTFTQDQSSENLRAQIENEYNQNDEGGRGGYIAGVEIELDALKSVQSPLVQELELNMYTAWINQNFNNDCVDGTGIIYIQFDDNDILISATVTSPLGEKIAGGLNRVMSDAGIYRLMDLDVVKKVCRGDICVCFEGNNMVRMATSHDEVQSFLESKDTWNLVRHFKSPE